ncbi:protein-L-isoaspartate O-methyltransferase [Rhizobium chutanense]|uniref:Protein-L-isoaspartate O-methyltransferase n=1 Tax=Rhizobium chutanense TaxID=2035448 RepID=A0A2A6J5W3_9HYPH|nr:protein-L-isoaspartate(D-aspartate) O-methyltransferase [Rhizobium chutanense]PDT01708.1 protein-L-isoaspartate O-methyltransferase [Rhizobium chutanense]
MDMTRIRDQMVEHHVTRRGIRDQNVTAAMRAVPREKFVAPGCEEFAYEDAPLSIGEGQTISQPFIVALMLEKAKLDAGDKVLEVGTGSGYASALISRIARQVYSIERHESLALQASERFEKLGYGNIDVRVGDGSKGWPQAAPFNAIIVSASAPQVPTALKEQLELGGRLIIPIGRGEEQQLKRITRIGATAFEEEDLGGVRFVPLIGEDAWTAAHPMYTAPAPSPPGAFASAQSLPRNAEEGGMGKMPKSPALPEGVLDHGEFQQWFWAVQRISWVAFCLSCVKRWWPRTAHIIDGVPTVLVTDGVYDEGALKGARLQKEDVMRAARSQEGIESVTEIKFAILEVSGNISIIKREKSG